MHRDDQPQERGELRPVNPLTPARLAMLKHAARCGNLHESGAHVEAPKPFSCPFCSKPLHLHGRVGDSDKPYTVYCERNALRVLRDGLRDYAMDTSLDFDSATRQVRLGDLIAMARKLIDGEMTLSSETKR